MLMDNEILANFPISEIVSKFPKSGQKQALLVKHNSYGLVLLYLKRLQEHILLYEEMKLI